MTRTDIRGYSFTIITLTSPKSWKSRNIYSVLIRIFDPKTDEVLVEHEYGNVSYELGRPELLDLLTSINDYDTDEE